MKLAKKSGEVTQLVPSINHTQDFVIDDHTFTISTKYPEPVRLVRSP